MTMRMYLVQSQYLPGSVWQLDPPGSGQPGTSLYPMMCLLQQYAVNWPSAVHRVGEPPRFADVALVLYPDAPCIVGPVAGVPGYVRLVHRPPYLAVRGANRVVRGDVYEGVGEPVYGARPRSLGGVDDDLVYGVGARAASVGVVV